PKLAPGLFCELCGAPLHRLRPTSVDEVFPSIEEEYSCFREIRPHPFDKIADRLQSSVVRVGASHHGTIATLDCVRRLNPDLPKETAGRRESMRGGPGRCPGRLRDGADGRAARALPRDAPPRRIEELSVMKLRESRHPSF